MRIDFLQPTQNIELSNYEKEHVLKDEPMFDALTPRFPIHSNTVKLKLAIMNKTRMISEATKLERKRKMEVQQPLSLIFLADCE